MNAPKHLFNLPLLVAVAVACTGPGTSTNVAMTPASPSPIELAKASQSPMPTMGVETPAQSLVSETDPSAFEPLTNAAIAACPITFPDEALVPREYSYWGNYGNEVVLVPIAPGGKIVPALEQWNEDGSLNWKLGMYRRIRGKLTVVGKRLDAPAPVAQGQYDIEGYGDIGFQAGGIYFPSQGCWEITARVGGAGLTFVTLVVRLPFESATPFWLPEQPIVAKDWDFNGLPNSVREIFVYDSSNEGQVSIETTRSARADPNAYPAVVTQHVTVNGYPALCVQGAWDEHREWLAEADAGVLQWTTEGFSYRIQHEGLGLSCEDLLRIAGALP